MYRVFYYYPCLLAWVASCAPAPSGTTEESAQQLLQEALVLFSHDHVLTGGHLQDARASGVTAMTMELTVDNMYWVDSTGMETTGPVGSGAQQHTIVDPPYETRFDATTRFSSALETLQDIVSPPGSGFRIVRTVQDIGAAKANGELGIIIGTEGALMLADNHHPRSTDGEVLAQIESRYADGWRKVQLYRAYKTPFVELGSLELSPLSALGRRVVPMLNKRGVVIDAMHLEPGHIDDLFTRTNAPIQVSHDWNVCGVGYSARQGLLDKIVAAGGGHGVISLNALTAFYDRCEHPVGVAGFVDTLVDLIDRVGVDHVGIGPDYMPEGGPGSWALSSDPGMPIPIESLIVELRGRINPETGVSFTDEEIKKILGGNLRDLYQRVWDPTHGYDGGTAHFRICSNSDPEVTCVRARSNGGQGDLRHRAINCAHPADLTPVGMKLAYREDRWMLKNLADEWVPCATRMLRADGTPSPYPGSVLVVSWGNPGYPEDARIALHGTPACDATCQTAIDHRGAGTAKARALSCQAADSNGIVGLQLVYESGAWYHYNLAGRLMPCAGNSTLVASWGSTVTPNAGLRRCDDHNDHPACAAAASNGGSGTARARALSCLSTTPAKNPSDGSWEHGTVALQVFYQDMYVEGEVVPGGGHWQYWDTDLREHPCVHGSVLVATTP